MLLTKARVYSIMYTEPADYLHAIIVGIEDSLETSIRFWSEVLSEARNRGLKKVLVEEDFDNVLSPLDMYALVKHFGIPENADLKIAFVDNQARHRLENEFAEMAAHNLGLNVCVCESVSEAAKWLKR